MSIIKIYTAEVITCAKYALEELGNDLSGLAGGGCGGNGGGCGCGGGQSLTTVENLPELLEDYGHEVSLIKHDDRPEDYYHGLSNTFRKMNYQVLVNDQTVEYIKSTYSPIITVDDEIISMGRVPEDYEIIDALENNTKVSVSASSGF